MSLAENVIENSLFTNAYRNYNFQVIKTNLFEMIALFHDLFEKVTLKGMGVPNL